MRITTDTPIGVVIDKLRYDADLIKTSERADFETTYCASKPYVPKSLADIHPLSIDAHNAIAVIINAFLAFRDKYVLGADDKRAQIVKHVTDLGGTISPSDSKNFHLSFSTPGDDISISILDKYIDFSSRVWYFRIHMTFLEDKVGTSHIFPMINVETGDNVARLYWSEKYNEVMSRCALNESALFELLNYAVSIDFNLGLSDKPISIKDHIVKPDEEF